MADITLTIPDQYVNRVLNGIAIVHGYEEEIDGQPNPETKAQFAKRMIKRWVKRQVAKSEGIQARRNAEDAVDNEIDIT